MFKLLIQIFIAVGIGFGSQAQGLHYGASIALIVAGGYRCTFIRTTHVEPKPDFEREEGYMHPKFQEHMARFKEVDVNETSNGFE